MNVPTSRHLFISAGAGLLGITAIFFFMFRRLVWYFAIAALVIGLIWIAGHYLLRLTRKKKQKQFDAGVAAREGIDDRKREWANWTEELERQDIDRYDLPFYLLVGEPQSGKSVLLQNSDLHFPFGQTRLSGIGGTRGCDWWFTEEAVILDLAGRLFTHEGGASDEAEWEAFLGLLTSYRPTCPANGVMLVIPSDSLARDSREEVGRKASQIQSALLTLTNKLQAQVPIFLILTKADRIFGFAETVHRLTVEQRQEMCGWSRPAEDFDAPFDIVEVRSAFEGLVGRARLLRETMLSTIRLPEGLPEVDRMYAFPDELAALQSNLEVYLKRVFSESALVDRLYFRGFYLTSGLQTGAPIAKVCAELMGSVGEADKRDLEALFSKQQSYFIRDLVRRRVFSERGLVQPTQTRVLRNRRRAWVGYGLAGAIAVISVIASLFYVLSDYDAAELNRFEAAIAASTTIANAEAPELDSQLDALDATWDAIDVRDRSLEAGMVSRHASFVELYEALCDERLVPELRRLAERAASTRENEELTDVDAFLSFVDSVQLLAAGFDPANREQAGTVLGLLPPEDATRISKALERRCELDKPLPQSTPYRDADGEFDTNLRHAVVRIESLWDRTLGSGDPLQVQGAAGYLVAWQATNASYALLSSLNLQQFLPEAHADFLESAASYFRSFDYLRSTESTREFVGAGVGAWELSQKKLDRELEQLEAKRQAFLRASRDEVSSEVRPESWPALVELRSFEADVAFPGMPADTPSEKLSGAVSGNQRKVQVPTAALESQLRQALHDVCDPTLLVAGAEDCRPDQLPRTLAGALNWLERDKDAEVEKTLFAKLLLLQADSLESYHDWRTLGRGILGSDESDTQVLVPVLAHLLDMREVVARTTPDEYPELAAPWAAAIDSALLAALRESDAMIAAWRSEAPLDTELLRNLGRAARIPGDIADTAGRRLSGYLALVDARMLDRWAELAGDSSLTIRVLDELTQYLVSAKAVLGEPTPQTLDRWLEGDVSDLLMVRIENHGKASQRANQAAYDSVSLAGTLPEAASQVQAQLQPAALRKWQEELDSFDVLDPKSLAPQLKELASWSALADTSAKLSELAMASARVSNPVNNDYRDFLVRYARQLGQPILMEEGPKLTEVLAEGRATCPPGPPETGVEHFIEGLTSELDKRAVKQLRELYVADLWQELGKLDDLMNALFAVDLVEPSAHEAEISAQLEALFKPGGRFDDLQKRYRQIGTTPLAFRPTTNETESPEMWACDVFLRQLREFIQDGNPTSRVNTWQVDIYMESSPRRDGVWKMLWLFASFDPGFIESRSALPADSVDRLGPLTWKFDGTQESLSLRWSSSTGKPQPDDARIFGSFCLAPLVLCWSSSFNDTLETSAKRWEVEVPIREGLSADFTLEFAHPLPHRPPRPE